MQKTSFSPLPPLKQSSPKDQERISCALKILRQTTQPLCNAIVCCFPLAYFCKYLQEVFIISMTISHKKKRTPSVLNDYLNYSLLQEYGAAAIKHLCFTQEGCRSGVLAQIPMPKEWYLCGGTPKSVRLRVPISAVSKVGACAGW